jgi:hypothetical protein
MAVTKQHLSTEDIDLSTDTIKITSGGTGYSTIDYGAIPPLTIGATGTSYKYSATPNVTIGSGLTSSNAVWTTSGTGTGWNSAVGATLRPSATLTLQGDNADIDINGKSMRAWMEKVEERLNILTPNAELEKDWDDLRKLGERYRKLEKKCKEKAEVWNKLKKL